MGFVNGATYRFVNKYFTGHALNVYGTNTASTGRNVCLYANTPSDIMQKWVVRTSGSGYRLHSAVQSTYVLDCSDGTISTSHENNAHLCATSQTSTTDSQVKFVKVSDNVYKIYLPGKGLYLTATNTTLSSGLPASSISSITALEGGSGGHSNVYWAKSSTSTKQQWTVSPSVDGGGGTPNVGALVWPTESRNVVRYSSNNHDGTDIAPKTPQVPGDEVYAYMDGYISMTGTPTSNHKEGYTVRIHHQNPLKDINGYTHIRTQYMHLNSAPLVAPYQKVLAGQLIGYMGNTGRVSPTPTPENPGAGTHLHFEVRGGSEKEFPLGGNSSNGFRTGTVLETKPYLDLT